MKVFSTLFLSILSFSIISCNNSTEGRVDEPPIPTLSFSIVSALPHNTANFTQGLEFYNNTLLEGTGLNGKSKLIQTDISTGKVIKELAIDSKYFGEGITVLHDTLYQLTYKELVAFAYNIKDFKKLKEFPFKGEGWGLTNDGKNLIVSNGSSSSLFYYEPGTMNLLKELPVTENGGSVININELEYINGFVYANQYQYPYILKINPANGEVVGKFDLTSVIEKVKAKNPDVDVLNGIAYNPKTDKIYITGKLWPEIYEMQFAH
ncbi:MAG: glutaminyl-peptide cyclotransferase [Flavisolibacter sp.]